LEDFHQNHGSNDKKRSFEECNEKSWNNFSLEPSCSLLISDSPLNDFIPSNNDPDYDLILSEYILSQQNDGCITPPPKIDLESNNVPASFSPSMFVRSRSHSTSPDHNSSRENGHNGQRRSSQSSIKTKEQKEKVPRHKRPSHINAEHRRRSKIQNCLDELNNIVPKEPESGTTNSVVTISSKKSKAALLSRS
jgi:hypothetical protein